MKVYRDSMTHAIVMVFSCLQRFCLATTYANTYRITCICKVPWRAGGWRLLGGRKIRLDTAWIYRGCWHNYAHIRLLLYMLLATVTQVRIISLTISYHETHHCINSLSLNTHHMCIHMYWVQELIFSVFLFKRALISNQNEETCYWKYWPSLAIIFRHFSGNLWIPLRKNSSSFEAIHESIHFLMSSKDWNRFSQGEKWSVKINVVSFILQIHNFFFVVRETIIL